MKASKKVLFTHFDYDLDSIEAGLSLPGHLLLEHLQMTHSLKSMRCGKLPRLRAFTQVLTCCLYFSHHFAGLACLERLTFFKIK